MKELQTIQATLNAPKGQYNTFGKYRYRSCEDILAAAKPLLSSSECTLVLTDEIVAVGNRIYVKATATITNAKGESQSATAYAREEDTKKGMDASQVTGAASSYARKYALNGLFAIDDTKDSDATNTHGADTAAVTAPQPSAQELTQKGIAEINAATSTQAIGEIWNRYYNACPAMCAQGSPFYLAVQARQTQLKSNTPAA